MSIKEIPVQTVLRVHAINNAGSVNEDEALVRAALRAADRIDELETALEEAAITAIAATSAYKTFAKRHKSQGKALEDALYGTRLKDFEKSVEVIRSSFRATCREHFRATCREP